VDELNSHLGIVQATITDAGEKVRLTRIQNRVFVVSSNLAVDKPELAAKLPQITDADITELEQAMDMLLDQMPALNHFILPAGDQTVAFCHVARTVCRRAERRMITLAGKSHVEPILIRYINRLSDYLFVLARKAAHDLGIAEVTWTSDFRSKE
jgi:cob(I)alamin adenosyltransferase